MIRYWWIPIAVLAFIGIGLLPAAPAKPKPPPVSPPSPPNRPAAQAPSGKAKPTAGPQSTSAQTVSIGELSATLPADWKSQPPGSEFRLAQYTTPPAKGDAAPPVFIAFYFGAGQGGTAEDNVQRWIGMVKQPDGADSAKVAKRGAAERPGLKITTLDLSGTYLDRPTPMAEESTPRPGYRFLAAVVETAKTGGKGPYFFRLVGPVKSVALAKPAWDRLLSLLKAD